MDKIDGAHIPGLTDRMVALHNEMFELISRAANLVVEAQRERDGLRARVEALKVETTRLQRFAAFYATSGQRRELEQRWACLGYSPDRIREFLREYRVSYEFMTVEQADQLLDALWSALEAVKGGEHGSQP